MLFLDSASISSWHSFAPTRMFAGLFPARDHVPVVQREDVAQPPADLRHAYTGTTTNPAILQRDGVECTVPSLQRFAATVSVRRCAQMRRKLRASLMTPDDAPDATEHTLAPGI